MSNDKLNDVFFSRIEKDQDGEFVLLLPDEVVKRFNLSDGSELIIIIQDNKLVITRA